MTTGPLYGPPTFAQWLRTCTIEITPDGWAADLTAEVTLTGPAAQWTAEVRAVDLLAPAGGQP